jgi:hypothetical protein
MKSITRLSLTLIMFSLFSISYLVTSEARECDDTKGTCKDTCMLMEGEEKRECMAQLRDVGNRDDRGDRYKEDAQGLIKTKETDLKKEIAVLKARVKEVELQLLAKCKP